MPTIRQDDLVANISVTRAYTNLFSISVTTGNTIPANVLNAAQGAVYSENKSVSNTFPLWIKSNGNSSQGWIRESDWQIHNQVAVTNTILFYNAGSNSSITPTVQNITISIGTPVAIYGAGTWGLVANPSISRVSPASAGSQNSSFLSGGDNPTSFTYNEIFNGSSWTFGSNINVSRNAHVALGTLNSGLIGTGNSAITSTETFNGFTWTVSANLRVSRTAAAGAGSQNAAIIAGGLNSGNISSSEYFNGTSWTSGANLSISGFGISGAGTQNSALVSGWAFTFTQIYNGSAWSYSGFTVIARSGSAACGTVNAYLFSGGNGISSSEIFNGSAWSLSGNMTASRNNSCQNGSQNAAMISGGNGLLTSEVHNQTIYRPLNYQNYKSAKNIGIVAQSPGGGTATTISVAFSGYINNAALTSNNIAITSAAQAINTYLTLPRNSSTTQVGGTSTVDGFINQTITTITNDTIILGLNLSNTEIVMLGNTLANLSPWVRW